MGPIPRDAVLQADDRTLLFEYLPEFVGRRRPVPTPLAGLDRRFLPKIDKGPDFSLVSNVGVEVGDKISSQPVLMRGLPRSRFRSFLGEQLELPLGMAERLEDFETALRKAGFIGPDQMLVQSFYFPGKFRVKGRDVPADSAQSADFIDFVHGDTPVKAATPLGGQAPPSKEFPRPSVAPAAGQGRRAQRPLTREAAKAINGAVSRAKPRR